MVPSSMAGLSKCLKVSKNASCWKRGGESSLTEQNKAIEMRSGSPVLSWAAFAVTSRLASLDCVCGVGGVVDILGNNAAVASCQQSS